MPARHCPGVVPHVPRPFISCVCGRCEEARAFPSRVESEAVESEAVIVLRSFFRHRSRRGVLRRAWSHACFIIVASAARAAPGIRICMAANSDQVSDLVNLVASLMLHATRVNVVGGLGFQALRGPCLGAQWQRCQIRRASRLCTETSGCRRTARFVTVICC